MSVECSQFTPCRVSNDVAALIYNVHGNRSPPPATVSEIIYVAYMISLMVAACYCQWLKIKSWHKNQKTCYVALLSCMPHVKPRWKTKLNEMHNKKKKKHKKEPNLKQNMHFNQNQNSNFWHKKFNMFYQYPID